MTIFVLNAESESLRGELTRWFLEVKPNVFVGKINTRIRSLLWERICEGKAQQGAVMIYDAPNEQGFKMELCGSPKRRVVDLDGIQLIRVEADLSSHEVQSEPLIVNDVDDSIAVDGF